MWVIEIVKYPDRKRKAISVYDTENPVTHYTIADINNNEELFKKALEYSRNVVCVKEVLE